MHLNEIHIYQIGNCMIFINNKMVNIIKQFIHKGIISCIFMVTAGQEPNILQTIIHC